MRILNVSAALVALTAPMASSAMANDDWSITPLAYGWSLYEKGDLSNPAEHFVKGVYEGYGPTFSFGCTRGYAFDVVWKPDVPITGGALVPVTITIDDVTVVDGNLVPNDRNEYAWTGRDGAAYDIVANIWDFWEGDLTLSAGGVTDTVYFNEDDLGGISELVLASCGKF
ncbi:hypothetical protein [Aquisalinus flavus]|uniref:Uncharacterized protein n=1 Tax=Aquisalinus flavus TaxID=1526572 RepID=A0A8J2V2E7_9PROT|nr:hypothetical protein [Aquisalinus flavus]MBD0427309.1 hypothetical protein [Aquisalinus flavus]UNE47116.1 hypothetical protein FF099_03115 [Aquisalinus flavus]GGC99969.1 hypothetical protein GCM10011342_06240 [Aquisalinus flavus]